MKALMHRLLRLLTGPVEHERICRHGRLYSSCYQERRYGGGWPW